MGQTIGFLGKRSVLATLALGFTLLMTGCSSDGDGGSTPDFSVSDFDGNWSMHGISFGLPGSGDYNLKGLVSLDGSGKVVGGDFATSDGLEAPLTGGSLVMQENGEFNGTIVIAGQFNLDLYSGKMNPSKNILVGVDLSEDIASNGLGALIKNGGTFATSDLKGKWYMFGPSVGGELGSPEGTVWGTFELDENGSVTDGIISTSDGLSVSAAGGTIAMNSAGEVNGTITAEFATNELNVTVDSGKMDPSKSIMFMTSETGAPLNSNELIAAVKSVGGTINTTLALKGKWYLYGVSMGSTFGKLTITGYMDVDAEGKVTDGVYISRGEETALEPLPAQILSGEMHFENDGTIGGRVVANINTGSQEINTTITLKSGRLSAAKDVAVIVTDDDLGENAFMIGIKGK